MALVFAFAIAARAADTTLPVVRLEPLPEKGVQPKLKVGPDGTLHAVYLTGDERASNVRYVRRAPKQPGWSAPEPVNSRPGTALAVGTIRGADLALGPTGSVHVVWFGSAAATERPTNSSPLLYSRRPADARAFEPERNLIRQTRHLDGGGSVAADPAGNVFVVWHASGPAVPDGEEARTVFVAQSSDNGVSFTPERSVSPEALGACGCCGLKSAAGPDGTLYTLFRTARGREDRDMVLLRSRNHGASFDTLPVDPWKASQCPMSLPSVVPVPDGVLLAWETGRHVRFARLAANATETPVAVTPPGTGRRRHPVAVANSKGVVLLAWSEGTGWQKGGSVEWQLFDPAGKPVGPTNRATDLPVWSLPAAAALPDDSFVVTF